MNDLYRWTRNECSYSATTGRPLGSLCRTCVGNNCELSKCSLKTHYLFRIFWITSEFINYVKENVARFINPVDVNGKKGALQVRHPSWIYTYGSIFLQAMCIHMICRWLYYAKQRSILCHSWSKCQLFSNMPPRGFLNSLNHASSDVDGWRRLTLSTCDILCK